MAEMLLKHIGVLFWGRGLVGERVVVVCFLLFWGFFENI